jgi:hypothetical protein
MGKGVTISMAPFSFWGQKDTQAPQNQHSSGYISIGGFPSSGFGAKASHMHTSTQVLHPVQVSSLK